MKILHIAYLEDNPYSGVCVVVPQHIKAHQELGHEVAFLNIFGGRKVEGIDCQISNIEDFPNPDIVVFHECYRKVYLKLGKRFVSEGIPYIVIPHGELSNDAQKKKHLKKVTANILLFNKFTIMHWQYSAYPNVNSIIPTLVKRKSLLPMVLRFQTNAKKTLTSTRPG